MDNPFCDLPVLFWYDLNSYFTDKIDACVVYDLEIVDSPRCLGVALISLGLKTSHNISWNRK